MLLVQLFYVCLLWLVDLSHLYSLFISSSLCVSRSSVLSSWSDTDMSFSFFGFGVFYLEVVGFEFIFQLFGCFLCFLFFVVSFLW